MLEPQKYAGKLDEADQKKFKEISQCFRRAKAHLIKNAVLWPSNKQLMYGMYSSSTSMVKNNIAEAYGMFRGLVSSILVQTPECYFEAALDTEKDVARVLTDATNFDFHIAKYHEVLKKALWQNFPYGMGVITEQVESEKSGKSENKELVDKQRFFWLNNPCRDTLFDPDGFAISLSDHRFIFTKYYKTIAKIKEEKKSRENEEGYYNIEDIEKIPRANQTTNTAADAYFREDRKSVADMSTEPIEDFHQIAVWRMYDRTDPMVYDITDFGPRLIRKAKWPLQVEIQGQLQFPVRILAMNSETDDFYPPPEVTLIRSQLIALTRLNDKLMEDLTRKWRKYMALTPWFKQADVSKLIDETQPNTVILTSSLDTMAATANQSAVVPEIHSAADVVSKIPDIEPSRDLVAGMAEVRNQIQNITGIGPPQRGGMPAVRNAKEAARLADLTEKNLLVRRSPIEQLVADSALYHALLIKKGGSALVERYGRHSDNLTGLTVWEKLDPEDIPDEKSLFCQVYAGSSTPKTLDSKRAQFLSEAQVMQMFLKENGFSSLPLLERYMDIFQVKYRQEFLKSQKGAAMEAYAAILRAGQLKEKTPPDLLAKTMMGMIHSMLNKDEMLKVQMAVQGDQGGNGKGESPAPSVSANPEKDGGNQPGMVS